MGEPEQWAVELWRKALASYYGPTCVIPERAALTIQRAFEERERKLREAVAQYGKPGGPWNAPSDPGGWLARAQADHAAETIRSGRADGSTRMARSGHRGMSLAARTQALFDKLKEFPEASRCEHGAHLKPAAYAALLDLRQLVEREIIPALECMEREGR